MVTASSSPASLSSLATALDHQSRPLFSRTEKRIIGIGAGIMFVAPLLCIYLTNRPMTRLQAHTPAVRALAQAKTPVFGDEASLASHFTSQAKALLASSNPLSQEEARLLLDQAEQQLSLATESEKTALQHEIAQVRTALADQTSPTTGGVVIAAAQESSAEAVTTEASSNATSQELVFPAGTTTITVAYPSLQEGSQIYLSPQGSTENAVLFVARKEAGVGFTIQSTAPLSSDLVITWYEIQPE